MKHKLHTSTNVTATFSFDGGYEEIFVEGKFPHTTLMQDGDYLQVPSCDFRAFLKALSEWADEAGIPA